MIIKNYLNLLFYRTYGNGFPLIILHGLYGSSDNWVTIGKILSKDFKVIIPDQRNHGQSFHHPAMDFETLTEDLKMFVDELELKKFHLIGHSIGGKVAANFTQQYPDRVGKVVFVDISPYNTTPSKKIIKFHQLVISVLNELDLSAFTDRESLKNYLLAKLFSPELVNFLMKNFYQIKNKTFVSKLNIEAIYNHMDAVLGEIEITNLIKNQAMILKGGNSDYFKASDFPYIKLRFPNAEMKIIEGTTHWVHAEKPKEFLELISSFLKSA